MNLTKQYLINSQTADSSTVASLDLPEKVLQFGTGVLLRGLPDYFIDKANKQGIFNGRIVVVKSTATGDADAFSKQDGLYTVCIRGIQSGKKVEENILNTSISRVLSAKTEWQRVLDCAANPDMQVVISNTTEVGITLLPTDDIESDPPESFPGKLLAFLYKRYQVFNGDPTKGMVIVPTELIPDNGKKLESIIEELAHLNKLEYEFIDWLENANYFCNSLVDRIVPGKLPAAKQTEVEQQLGYTDELMIMSEVYRLWAIESGEEKVKSILSFAKADDGVIIADNIDRFRELKLRLLNGSHTFSCGLAHLAGFHTVKDAMNDDAFAIYISNLMMQEITPAILNNEISAEEAKDFAIAVLDRYRNPHIDHQWLSITMQYSSKMQMRNVPTILKYYEKVGAVPEYMSLGFAAHILFMRSEKDALNKFWGEVNGRKYLINDDKAVYYAEAWKQFSTEELVQKILSNKENWGTDLSVLPGFTDAVYRNLKLLLSDGAVTVLTRTKQVMVAA
jgi:tagaturonate reductase